uniref:BPTI/Kunitz inhibitor domain-containing protein n=1 Tax=Globodera pallida TaxID=36090 RepID=A0A183BIL0_GLOPA
MTSSSGGIRTRKRTVDHVVKRVFRRKVCLICFGFTVFFFGLLLAGAITLTVVDVDHLNEIKTFLRKQSALKSRTDIEAFYEIECPIYGKKPGEWDPFETAFCNRYCDRNFKFEFMYRQLDPKKKFMSRKNKESEPHNCPVYVELRQCQTEDGGHCEKKIFNEDFITVHWK